MELQVFTILIVLALGNALDSDGGGLSLPLKGRGRNQIDPQKLVPLRRYYNKLNGDHFYTIVWSNASNDRLAKLGYKYEGVAGTVLSSPISGAVPLHRFVLSQGNRMDHIYITSWSPLSGYEYQGVECYVFPEPTEGTLPLFRYYNPGTGDHFYTTNWNELKGGTGGYVSEGIQAYIFPEI